MSNPSWQARLTSRLNPPPTDDRPRVAVVGIGHELNGDDGAGIAVARALLARAGALSRLLVLDAGPAPENTTGALRTFAPDLVVFVDAAQMNEPPGTVRWLAWQDTTGISASTHTLPLHVLAQFLTADLGCDVALIGIQPQQNRLDAPLSPPVRAAVESVVDALAAALAS